MDCNNHNLSGDDFYDKFKDNNKYLKKNSSNINEFVIWKYFHSNKNIEPLSNKRKFMKNWYKNLDKLSQDNHDNYSSINNWIYGIKNSKNNVKLVKDDGFFKSIHSLSP